jgi:hypothetical protein
VWQWRRRLCAAHPLAGRRPSHRCRRLLTKPLAPSPDPRSPQLKRHRQRLRLRRGGGPRADGAARHDGDGHRCAPRCDRGLAGWGTAVRLRQRLSHHPRTSFPCADRSLPNPNLPNRQLTRRCASRRTAAYTQTATSVGSGGGKQAAPAALSCSRDHCRPSLTSPPNHARRGALRPPQRGSRSQPTARCGRGAPTRRRCCRRRRAAGTAAAAAAFSGGVRWPVLRPAAAPPGLPAAERSRGSAARLSWLRKSGARRAPGGYKRTSLRGR